MTEQVNGETGEIVEQGHAIQTADHDMQIATAHRY